MGESLPEGKAKGQPGEDFDDGRVLMHAGLNYRLPLAGQVTKKPFEPEKYCWARFFKLFRQPARPWIPDPGQGLRELNPSYPV
jgi:hypothetical protein